MKIEESCIYTLTPDRNPVIDIMPGINNIVIAAGFSGNKTTLSSSSDQKEKLEKVEKMIFREIFIIQTLSQEVIKRSRL